MWAWYWTVTTQASSDTCRWIPTGETWPASSEIYYPWTFEWREEGNADLFI